MKIKQNDGLLDVTNRERLIVTVENQYFPCERRIVRAQLIVIEFRIVVEGVFVMKRGIARRKTIVSVVRVVPSASRGRLAKRES